MKRTFLVLPALLSCSACGSMEPAMSSYQSTLAPMSMQTAPTAQPAQSVVPPPVYYAPVILYPPYGYPYGYPYARPFYPGPSIIFGFSFGGGGHHRRGR